jgi:hypothetical protein
MTAPLKRSMDSTRRGLVPGFGFSVKAGAKRLVLAVDIVKQVLAE